MGSVYDELQLLLWSFILLCLSDIVQYRPMFLAPVDIHGFILFNIIVITKIVTNDSHLWSCVYCYQFLALYNTRALHNNHICKSGKFHCVCNLL